MTEPVPTKAQRTRALLIRATREELAATGSFTAERVGARAKTSAATFYAYFPTKDDALAAALASSLDDLLDRSEAILTAETLLERGLAATVRRLVGEVVAFFGADALVFRAALARLPDSRAIRVAYREAERRNLEHQVRFVQWGQAAGAIRPGDPARLAELAMVFSQGLNNPRLLRLDAEHPLLDDLATMLTAGLAALAAG